MNTQIIEAAWSGPPQCENCGIRHLVLFADLEREDFGNIHQPISEMDFRPGEFLYKQNDPARFVFTLRRGLVKLVRYQIDGRHRITRLLKMGDLAGIEALGGGYYEQYAIVLEPVSVCRIPVETVQTLNATTPRLYKTLTTRWQRAVHDADVWLTEFSTGPARKRVCSLLLYLSSLGKQDKSFFLPNREDVGSLLAITTETASKVTADLRRKGILQVDQLNPRKAWANIAELRKWIEK